MLSLSEITEKVNDRWEVCVSLSDGQFQQVSFVNSIATIKGGTLTICPSSFGSKCELPPEFLKKVAKSGIVDSLLSWANFKQNKDLKKTDVNYSISVTAHQQKKTFQKGKVWL
ncbi:DNA topoisomerase 2-like [Humulus lupulus]|uniref:DNA topoisomerase 2-like n=1 Tax=Humulus lupulus TaxID=3486 RepID=UPI002B40AE4F|nr:DNA topoisomerase 2-like [Humulus lupulus]